MTFIKIPPPDGKWVLVEGAEPPSWSSQTPWVVDTTAPFNERHEGDLAKVIEDPPRKPGHCHDCDVRPGMLHADGCDVERCSLCGGQRIGCYCLWVLSNVPSDASVNGDKLQEMNRQLDAEVERYGGRLPWTGVWPFTEQAIELGFYTRWVSLATGEPIEWESDAPGRWVACAKDDVGARPDTDLESRRYRWSKEERKWVR